jgi:hypothetical protein
MPSSEMEESARAQTLGGSTSSSGISAVAALADDRDDMRIKMLEAATRRMNADNEETG